MRPTSLLNTAVYLRNRSPTARLGATTPFEAYKGRKPDLSHLRVFGSQAWVHVPKENRKKLDDKAVEGTLMGYGETSLLYRILLNGKIKLYRDVRFNELHPAQSVVHLPIGIEQESAHPLHAVPQPDPSAQPLSQHPMQFATPQSLPPRQHSHASESPSRQYGRLDTVDEDTSETTYESAEEGEESDKSSAHSSGYKQRSKGPPPPREPSRRERRAPQRFDEEFNYFETFLSYVEPRNYKEAVATADAACWKAAALKEMDSLQENKTWKVVPCEEGMKPLESRWVFKRKKIDGKMGYKARLVAKGFLQRPGDDYMETFAPVSKFSSLRTVLATAAFYDLELDLMDFVTAFLNGNLDVRIHMKLPEGFEKPGYVAQLLKCLYGLKQSPRRWYQKLHAFLLSIGFTSSSADPCLYFKKDGQLSVLVYVDDLLIAGRRKQVDELKRTLSSTFNMKNLGPVETFLGITIQRDRAARTIAMSQSTYLKAILEKCGMTSCNGVSTPLATGTVLWALPKDKDGRYEGIVEHDRFRSIVGSLLWITGVCRPDLSYTTSLLARHMHAPGKDHWAALKHCLRYIKKTADYKTYFGGKNSSLAPEFYADSDFAGDVNTRKSTSGMVVMLNNGPIAWKSKLQMTVAQSTMEAEYIAMAVVVKEALWFSQISLELTGRIRLPMRIYSDNAAAIALSKDPQHHEKAKHIDIRLHFIRDEINQKRIIVTYMPSKENIADILTKVLPRPLFENLIQRLNVKPE
jgi:hypothetical protein